MTDFDVFNGDADGLCALTQLRNAQPDSRITVLDVSLDKNRAGLERALGEASEWGV